MFVGFRAILTHGPFFAFILAPTLFADISRHSDAQAKSRVLVQFDLVAQGFRLAGPSDRHV